MPLMEAVDLLANVSVTGLLLWGGGAAHICIGFGLKYIFQEASFASPSGLKFFLQLHTLHQGIPFADRSGFSSYNVAQYWSEILYCTEQ